MFKEILMLILLKWPDWSRANRMPDAVLCHVCVNLHTLSVLVNINVCILILTGDPWSSYTNWEASPQSDSRVCASPPRPPASLSRILRPPGWTIPHSGTPASLRCPQLGQNPFPQFSLHGLSSPAGTTSQLHSCLEAASTQPQHIVVKGLALCLELDAPGSLS